MHFLILFDIIDFDGGRKVQVRLGNSKGTYYSRDPWGDNQASLQIKYLKVTLNTWLSTFKGNQKI